MEQGRLAGVNGATSRRFPQRMLRFDPGGYPARKRSMLA
jgi:hypothetical protein